MGAQVLFSGQGKISLHTRVGGVAQGGLLLGNTPNFKISLATTVDEHIEAQSGNRLADGRLQKSNKVDVSFDLENWTKENLALGLYGTVNAQGTGTVTAESLAAAVTAGQLVLFAKQNVSSLVIKDSTGSPKTLPVGQYTANLKAGSAVLDDITTGGPYTQPFKADYAYGDANSVSLFTQTIPERWLRFEGVNTANNNDPVVVDIYRVALDPFTDLDLINDSFAKFPMKGGALVDSTKPAGGTLGQFGRIILM